MQFKSSAQHPGRVLREEYLEPMGIAVGDLARAIRVDESNVNDLVSTQRGCSGDMALRLARALNTKPQFWMGLQANYELYQAKLLIGDEIETNVEILG